MSVLREHSDILRNHPSYKSTILLPDNTLLRQINCTKDIIRINSRRLNELQDIQNNPNLLKTRISQLRERIADLQIEIMVREFRLAEVKRR